jgi:hypothetical protein
MCCVASNCYPAADDDVVAVLPLVISNDVLSYTTKDTHLLHCCRRVALCVSVDGNKVGIPYKYVCR